jgi:TPR repeat protein
MDYALKRRMAQCMVAAVMFSGLTASTVANEAPEPVRTAATSAAAEGLWQKGSGFYDRKNFRDAFAAYSQAANLGHPRAMAVLGNMYREGEGVPKDPAQAVKWYSQAAMRGNRGAQFSLGSMYEEGEGVPKNVVKAAQLYDASARQGLPEAQFALGLSYEFGRGVPRNRRTAIYWLAQVAKQGDGRAKWYADWLSRPDTPQFRDEAQLGQYTASKVRQRVYTQMGAGNRGGVGSLNGIDQSGRNSLASDLEKRGDYNRAATCRAGGGC